MRLRYKFWEDAQEEPKGSALDLMILTLTDFIENEPDEDKVDLEDCEQMLEKLKAWKRLKDLDTEILGWEIRDMPTGGNWQTVNVKLNIKARKEPMELLDLLFGGEE